jgi:hypothetical protein
MDGRGGGLEPKKPYQNKVRASCNIFSPGEREAIFPLKDNGKGRHCIKRSYRSKMKWKKYLKRREILNGTMFEKRCAKNLDK